MYKLTFNCNSHHYTCVSADKLPSTIDKCRTYINNTFGVVVDTDVYIEITNSAYLTHKEI